MLAESEECVRDQHKEYRCWLGVANVPRMLAREEEHEMFVEGRSDRLAEIFVHLAQIKAVNFSAECAPSSRSAAGPSAGNPCPKDI